jgi:hypothetical protein
MLLRCIPIAFALLISTRAPLAAQVSKTLDLSTKAGKNSYYVVFASRGGSSTGHAFVIWGLEDGVHRKSTIRAFGLYPESDGTNCSSAVRTVPGRVMDELLNHSVQSINRQLIVRVDEPDFRRSSRIARAWDCKHEFSLLSRDCVEFLRAVGDSLHLEMPRRVITRWSPQAYVRALLASVAEDRLELEDAVYEGSVVDKKPMLHGIMIFPDLSEIHGTFLGWKHHVGHGRLNGLKNGYRYEGEIVDYRAHGKGTLYRIADRSDTPIQTTAGKFENGTLQTFIRESQRRNRSAQQLADELGLIQATSHATGSASTR